MATTSPSARMAVPAHLAKFERVVPNGGEWKMAPQDWVLLQLSEGIAYVFDTRASRELALGGVIVCPPQSIVTLTASVLGCAVFRGMAISIGSLTGFLTALERQCLETDVARQCAPFLALAPEQDMARQMTQMFANGEAPALAARLALAQSFAELVAPQLRAALNKGLENEKKQLEVKGRLRQFIGQLPESELAGLSLGELARRLHCCERHVSRLFREEWGTSFPSYVSDIRLRKACLLLLQGNLKIIDVALESGHGSLAHFNYVFKMRYHMTPTEWRQRQSAARLHRPRPRLLQVAAAAAVMLSLAALSVCSAAQMPGGDSTVEAGTAVSSGVTPVSPPATNAADTHIFVIKRYEVLGNTLLSTDVISSVLDPCTGEAVGTNGLFRKVNSAKAALQLEYDNRGWVTAKVSLPTQTNREGVIQLQVTEGKLLAVRIFGNRYFSSNNIMRALPYTRSLLSGGRLLNSQIFQTELDRANANPDRQISPEVAEGLEPGTSALKLDVKDKLPLHGRLEFDNYSPAGTPDLRLNANVSYANLWQLDHTFGLQYGFSPEEMKPSLGADTHVSLYPIDAPVVSYYSGFYRAPLGPPASVEDQIAQNPTQFGYNETTKQFVQPPTTGRPEFTAYASRSTSGPTMYSAATNAINIPSTLVQEQTVTQQYTSQTTVGGRLSFPLPVWQGIQSSFTIGMDYKEDKVVTEPTYFITTTKYTKTNNISSAPLVPITSVISVPRDQTYPSLQYTPFFLGWNGSRQDHFAQFGAPDNRWSQINGGISLVAGSGGTFSRDVAFPTLISGNKNATTEFLVVRPQLSRTQVLPANFSLYANLSGQWANEPLLNLEQLELGGNGSMRGYKEGELYADTGWTGQAELRSPFFWRGEGRNKLFGMQVTLFTDYGEGFDLDQSAGQSTQHALWDTGAGFNFKFGPHVESHIFVAWPLLNSSSSTAGHSRIFFSVSAQL